MPRHHLCCGSLTHDSLTHLLSWLHHWPVLRNISNTSIIRLLWHNCFVTKTWQLHLLIYWLPNGMIMFLRIFYETCPIISCQADSIFRSTFHRRSHDLHYVILSLIGYSIPYTPMAELATAYSLLCIFCFICNYLYKPNIFLDQTSVWSTPVINKDFCQASCPVLSCGLHLSIFLLSCF